MSSGRGFVVPILFLAMGSYALAAGDDNVPVKPELRLRVSTHHGFVPLKLILAGELIGIGEEKIRTCSIVYERTWKVSGKELKETHQTACAARRGGRLPARFSKELTLEKIGTYSFRIVVEPVEERRIVGMSHEVRVFQAPVVITLPGNPDGGQGPPDR